MDRKPSYTEKYGGVMMILVINLVRNGNYGKSRNRETKVRKSI